LATSGSLLTDRMACNGKTLASVRPQLTFGLNHRLQGRPDRIITLSTGASTIVEVIVLITRLVFANATTRGASGLLPEVQWLCSGLPAALFRA
jgi:hypothetical protein